MPLVPKRSAFVRAASKARAGALPVPCPGNTERKADVRLRRVCSGKQPTRASPIDGSPRPLALTPEERRAVSRGSPAVVAPYVLGSVVRCVVSVEASGPGLPLVHHFDGSDGSVLDEFEADDSVSCSFSLRDTGRAARARKDPRRRLRAARIWKGRLTCGLFAVAVPLGGRRSFSADTRRAGPGAQRSAGTVPYQKVGRDVGQNNAPVLLCGMQLDTTSVGATCMDSHLTACRTTQHSTTHNTAPEWRLAVKKPPVVPNPSILPLLSPPPTHCTRVLQQQKAQGKSLGVDWNR